MTHFDRAKLRAPRILLFAIAIAITAAAAAVSSSPSAIPSSEAPTVIYLLRHAEKVQSTDSDPELKREGQRRALQLADQLGNEPISHIYSSEYRRTLATVAPLAQRLDIEIERYDAGNSEALVARVLGEARGKTVVISGHSNTVPGLAFLFGYPEQFTLEDSDYGDLFRLSIDEEEVEMTRLRFGD